MKPSGDIVAVFSPGPAQSRVFLNKKKNQVHPKDHGEIAAFLNQQSSGFVPQSFISHQSIDQAVLSHGTAVDCVAGSTNKK